MAILLEWDKAGERLYQTGIDRVVLFVQDASGDYPLGVAWNGVMNISESPSGGEPSPLYADNIKYLNLISNEEFGMSIEAYTYPDAFEVCDGNDEPIAGLKVTAQTRATFGLAWRTVLGNDVLGRDYGYKLHLAYGLLAAPSEKANASINDSPEAVTFNWDLTSTPQIVTSFLPTAKLTVDSTLVGAPQLVLLETALYGEDPTPAAYLPHIDDVITMLTP